MLAIDVSLIVRFLVRALLAGGYPTPSKITLFCFSVNACSFCM